MISNEYYNKLKESKWECLELIEGDVIQNLVDAFIESQQCPESLISSYRLWDYKKYNSLKKIDFKNDSNIKYLTFYDMEQISNAIGLTDCVKYVLKYPENIISAVPFPDNFFDFVVTDQLLEHADSDPFGVCRELYRVTKKGGYNIHTTNWQWPSHYQPDYSDYWRFSNEGLFKMFSSVGFNVTNIGYAGNFLWSLIFSLWPYFSDFWDYNIPNDPKMNLYKLAMTVDIPYDHFIVREFGIHCNWIICEK